MISKATRLDSFIQLRPWVQAEARSWLSNEETLYISDQPPQTTGSSKKMESWSVLLIAVSLIPRAVPGRQKVLGKHLLNGRS